MKNRIFLLLLACIFLLALVPGASAQGTDCLNLPEADCAAIQAAEANNANINSFQLGLAIDFTLSGLESLSPDAGGGIEFHLTGQGPFAGSQSQLQTASMSGDIASILSAFQMQMDGNISVTSPGESTSTPYRLVITNGTVYVQDPQSEQWVGMTGDTIAAQIEQYTSMMGPMAGGSTAPTSPDQMMSQIPPELMTAISSVDWEKIAQTPGFLNYQRLPDETLMDQAMSPFKFTADFGTLFKSPDFQTAVNQIVQAAAQASSTNTTDPQAAQQAQTAAMMIPMFLNNTTGTLDVTQWVSSSDQFVHKVAVDLNANMDLNQLMAASGGNASSGTQMPPVVLTLHFEITRDQINQKFDIAAPEGAQIITPDQMGGSS